MDDIGEYLMPNQSLRKAIRDIRSETGIGWDVIEQDYVLSSVTVKLVVALLI